MTACCILLLELASYRRPYVTVVSLQKPQIYPNEISSTSWIKVVSQPMTIVKHCIRGDWKPVSQQVCANSCINTIKQTGEMFSKGNR